ncbi:MAG: flagellar hook-associated protein FlgL [Firmicutes bacterium]|nr:flagellar hook-associated protein FlgL [Bacillota bacterium]
MRITNQMMVSSLIENIHANLRALDRTNQQAATGKRFSQPSEDPVGTARSMSLRHSIAENEKYINNVDEGDGWMSATDLALDQVTNLMQRARQIAVAGANGTNTKTEFDAYAKELDQIIRNVVQSGNTMHDGRYLFGGYKTTTEPFKIFPDAANPTMVGVVRYEPGVPDTSNIDYEISQGTTLTVNITGDSLFTSAGPPAAPPPLPGVGNKVLDSLIRLRQHLSDAGNNVPGALGNISTDLTEVDAALENLTMKRSEVGAKVNRLEDTKSRLLDLKTNFDKLLSLNEDADMAQVAMDLGMQEAVYRAALDAGARIIQPSLMDFLR